MLKKLILVTVLVLGLSAPLARAAIIQSDPSREAINSFKSQIKVGKDAMISVNEEIQYDMDGVSHHGLERLIPVSSALDDGKYINYDFELISVSEDNSGSAKYSLAQENSWYRLRIGDANKTLTGIHNYTINYTYGPVVTQTNQGDVFDYNIFGTDWVLPAKTVEAEITFPTGVTIKDQLCFSGISGSTLKDCTVTTAGQTVKVVANRELRPKEGIDLQVLLPSGSFTAYTGKSDRPASPGLNGGDFAFIGIAALFICMGLIFLGSVLFQSISEHRAKKRQIIVPEYESPNSLSPAEVGMLIDKNFGGKEIVATIVDLAIRGYLRIRETRPKSWFKKAEYELDLLKQPTALKDYESTVLNLIYEPNQLTSSKLPVTASLKKNSSTEAYAAFKSMTKSIESSLSDKSYFKAKSKFSLKMLKQATYIAIGIFIALAAAMAFVIKSFDVFGAVAVSLIGGASWFSKHQKYTQLGYQQWAKVKGFEWFLTVTEKDRMKFENAPAKTPALFNKLLPYAIALGVEKKWAKQFEAIDLSKATNWYVGNASGYSALALTTSLNSSFSSVVNSNVVPSANSGGFGGGGAGGGGGGGGGGGW